MQMIRKQTETEDTVPARASLFHNEICASESNKSAGSDGITDKMLSSRIITARAALPLQLRHFNSRTLWGMGTYKYNWHLQTQQCNCHLQRQRWCEKCAELNVHITTTLGVEILPTLCLRIIFYCSGYENPTFPPYFSRKPSNTDWFNWSRRRNQSHKKKNGACYKWFYVVLRRLPTPLSRVERFEWKHLKPTPFIWKAQNGNLRKLYNAPKEPIIAVASPTLRHPLHPSICLLISNDVCWRLFVYTGNMQLVYNSWI